MNTQKKVVPFMKTIKSNQDGYLKNFSLSSFLQIVCMEKNSCCLDITNIITGEKALLFINSGILFDVEYMEMRGSDAAIEILCWEHVDILLAQPDLERQRLIKEGINLLLFEAARVSDEKKKKASLRAGEIKKRESGTILSLPKRKASVKPIALTPSKPNKPVTKEVKTKKREYDVDKVQNILDSFKNISGFLAVGIFSPEGEMIQDICTPGHDLASIGAIANELLVKAQSSTEMLGFGRGNLVHINAPKAHIFVSCMNESSGFQDNEFGKAHIHMALIINENGNQPMAKMKLKKGIAALAPLFR